MATFNLSKEMLSPQQHYDWGLRALKTVLKGSGLGLQTLRRKKETEGESKPVSGFAFITSLTGQLVER